MEERLDLLDVMNEKGIMKQLQAGEKIYISCPIFKFNDYRKRQQRGLLVTNLAVYNLKGEGIIFQQTSIKRKINIDKIRAITVSVIGNQFLIHVPSEYDYRYASEHYRQKIIYFIIKAYNEKCNKKMSFYCQNQLCLAPYATTKEQKKKSGYKQVSGTQKLIDTTIYLEMLKSFEEERQMIRKSTKTLFSEVSTDAQQVCVEDFVPKLLLGKGAFGKVFLVENKHTGQIYAMKTLDQAQMVEKKQVEHTKTEQMILEHVNHPFLVNLCYAFETQDTLYFIMKFMKGGQLFQHLFRRRRFTEVETKFYAMQIALGLGHLHSKDLIYRDLKLENVLMDENGYICLGDFGMSKIVKQGEMTKTLCGTPECIAPEVLNGAGYDKLADWWAMGIILYEMLYGTPPFYNSTNSQAQLFKMIKEQEVRFPQKYEVSVQAKELIVKLLNKDPRCRMGSKGDSTEVLAHSWFSSLDVKKIMRKQIQPPFKPHVQGNKWMDGFDQDSMGEFNESPETPSKIKDAMKFF